MSEHAELRVAIAALEDEISIKREAKRKLVRQCEYRRYYLKYKDKKIAGARQWYEAHKNDTYLCACCNKQIRRVTRSSHQRSQKYQEWLGAQTSGPAADVASVRV